METPIGKSQQNRDMSFHKGVQGNVARNIRAYHPHNSSLDLLRKQHHSSLDLNKPAQIESPHEYNFSLGHRVNFGVNSFLFYLFISFAYMFFYDFDFFDRSISNGAYNFL